MRWEILRPENYQVLMEEKQIHSLLAKVLCLRCEGLDNHVPLRDFSLFKDASTVLERIEKAIQYQEKVVIYGDYDCDGIMATSILVRAFELRGLNVGFHIPNRFVDGYGLNVQRVEEMAKKGYQLIITVDNGVSCHEAVARANELGIDVIITDHHDLPETLPEAYAIIHTRLSQDYPFKAISGGFVACKLATAILGQSDPYIYCMAALSTVSDMMPMIDENRTLVRMALQIMEKQHYLSFELLLGENQKYNANALGFVLAPKINSIGRLNDGLNPNQCIKYFKHSGAYNEQERQFKMQFASLAKEMNLSRQRLTTSQYDLATQNMLEIGGGLVACSTQFHEGLVGLIAGKMTNHYYRPSFVVHIDQDQEIYKGSARSIAGIDMYDLLSSLKEDLIVFGGHQMAGGFSLEKSHWQHFLDDLNVYLDQHLTEELLIEKKQAILLEPTDLSLMALRELASLEPFGQENEEPTFVLSLTHPTKIECLSEGKHLKLEFELPHGKLSALWFSHGQEYANLYKKERFEIYGQLSINKFRNFESIQMIIKEIH